MIVPIVAAEHARFVSIEPVFLLRSNILSRTTCAFRASKRVINEKREGMIDLGLNRKGIFARRVE